MKCYYYIMNTKWPFSKRYSKKSFNASRRPFFSVNVLEDTLRTNIVEENTTTTRTHTPTKMTDVGDVQTQHYNLDPKGPRASERAALAYREGWQAMGGAQYKRAGAPAGPLKSKYGNTGVSKRQPEGVITANIDVSTGLSRQREQNEASQDATRRIGVKGKQFNITIGEDELCFYRRLTRRWVGDNPIANQNASVEGFTSFNAEGIDESVRNQEQFEDLYGFAGRVKNTHDFERVGTQNEILSVQISGACSIANIGQNTWYYGDLLKYRLPNINARIRDEEQNRKAYPQNVPQSKLVAELVVENYDSIHEIGERGIHHFLQETYENPDHPNWDPSRLHALPKTDSEIMFMRERMRKTFMDALAGYAVFDRYFSVNDNGDLAIRAPGGLSEIQLTKRTRAFATFLGLMKNTPQVSEKLREFESAGTSRLQSGHVHREVFLLAHRGHITNASLFNVMRLFAPGTMVPMSDDTHLEQALTSAAIMDMRTYAFMMDINSRKIVGRVIKSYVPPGVWGDVLLGH